MVAKKTDYKRIVGQIPRSMHDKISHFNKVSSHPINVSKTIEACLDQEIKKIDEFSLNVAKGIYGRDHQRYSDEDFKDILADIKAGKKPSEIHSNYVQKVRDRGEDFDSPDRNCPISFVPLYPIDQVEVVEGRERIEFMAKGIFCYSVCTSKEQERRHLEIKQLDALHIFPNLQ